MINQAKKLHPLIALMTVSTLEMMISSLARDTALAEETTHHSAPQTSTHATKTEFAASTAAQPVDSLS